MFKIGEYQDLEVFREMPQGLYLKIPNKDLEILMPRAFVNDDMAIGDIINVFVYCDSQGREMASTEKPILTVNNFAPLMVTSVSDVGAFCEWGTSKELLVPFSNQARKMKEGQMYVVYMYLDKISDRLVGTTKLRPFLEHEAPLDFELGQEVDLLVYDITPIGYRVVVNGLYSGLVYKNETEEGLHIGETVKGYLKKARTDDKIDVSLHPVGHKSISNNEEIIINALKEANGFLPYSDKSHPDDIRDKFGISKKLFKKIIGSLYKQRMILIEEKGISLNKK